MPIKFRCNYCRQFLGISRAQAGGIVDCPTCGRSIRVPMLDGTLQPLPEPELNLQDAQLARALDELARLSIGESEPVSKSAASDIDVEDEVENEIPQPIPEPIPIEVPLPPTPIAINPPLQTDNEPRTPPPELSSQERVSAAKSSELNALSELAALALPDNISMPAERLTPSNLIEANSIETRPSASLPAPLPPARQHRMPIPAVSLLIALVFVAGMLFERFVNVLEGLSSKSAETPAVETGVAEPEVVSQVTGRITYKSPDGTSLPDRGARIIAFPNHRDGEVRLSVVGFRPADSEADVRIAVAALEALGGAQASADDAGQFRLNIPAGSYQLLILSHFQSRDEGQPIDPDLQKLLAAYFDKPQDLLGRVKYEFAPLRVKGTGDVRDHSF
jgi:hypothetical protein